MTNKTVNELLLKLSDEGINYALYGSYGLLFYKPLIAEQLRVSDCDVLLSREDANVLGCIQFLQNEGFDVYVWNELHPKTQSLENLKGKFYFRISVDNFQIDFTFEHDYVLTYDHVILERTGIRVLSEKQIIESKRQSKRPGDEPFLKNYFEL